MANLLTALRKPILVCRALSSRMKGVFVFEGPGGEIGRRGALDPDPWRAGGGGADGGGGGGGAGADDLGGGGGGACGGDRRFLFWVVAWVLATAKRSRIFSRVASFLERYALVRLSARLLFAVFFCVLKSKERVFLSFCIAAFFLFLARFAASSARMRLAVSVYSQFMLFLGFEFIRYTDASKKLYLPR